MFARKRFGQHFLVDQNVVDQLVSLIAPSTVLPIVEIGPGRGVLTSRLLDSGAMVHAIEIDRDLIALLSKKYATTERLKLHEADILAIDLESFGLGLCKVVGNLPYNISTPLFFKLMRSRAQITEMCFMVQREVAERAMAAPGSGNYGRLSVMLQAHFSLQLGFHVPPEAFSPPPRVDSSVITMQPLPHPPMHFERLENVVAAAFLHRRKMLRHTLGRVFSGATLEALEIDLRARPENVTVAQYIALAEAAPLNGASLIGAA